MTVPIVYESNWTPERVEQLKALWATGKSCSQIGTVLGISRNAVLGKVSRLKLPKHGTNQRKKLPQSISRRPGNSGGGEYRRTVRARDIAASPEGRQVNPRGTSTVAEPILTFGPAWRALPGTKPVPLLKLKTGQCKWPIGDRPILFCGCPVETEGKPYCSAHHERSVRVIK